MADTNLFDQGLESRPAAKTTPTASGNLFDQGFSGGGGVSASVPTPTPVPPPASSNLFDAGFGSPTIGQPAPAEPEKHLYQDETQPWYKRGFDWLNTPLIDFNHAMSPEGAVGKAFGRTSEAGGFERGVENIVSGLTSPLSVALTLGTFGTGGLLESAGATALKEAGGEFAENLPQIMKAARAAVDTYKAAPESATAIEDAVKATGIDPALWSRAQNFLHENKLTEQDLLGGDLIDRGVFQILHKAAPGSPIVSTIRAAKTAKTLMNTGFTYQMLESASAMAPRFLDALKEGDTDKALEYGTEFFASGALGVAGASHALHSWGELIDPVLSTKLRPSDTNIAIQKTFGIKEAEHAEAEEHGIKINQEANRLLGDNPADKVTAVLDVHTGAGEAGSQETAAKWFNALSEADGIDERLPVPGEPGPNNGQPPVGQVNVESAPGPEFEENLPGYAKASPEEKATYHQEKMQIVKDALRASGFHIVGEDTGHGYWGGASNPVTGFHIAGDPATVESAAKLVHQVLGDQNSIGYTIPHGPSPEGNELEFNFEHPLTADEVSKIGQNLEASGVSAYPEVSDPHRLRIINYSGEHTAPNYTEGIIGLVHDAVPGRPLSPITNHTETNLAEEGTPSPIAEKARQAIDELNRERGFTRDLGTPSAPPTRANTKVVLSNEAGEVRVGADGRPVVWLTPDSWAHFTETTDIDKQIKGVSFSPAEAGEVAGLLHSGNPVRELFDAATKTSPQGLLTTGRNNVDVQVASEEIHHTWQRELSQDGEIANLFKPVQWKKLYDIIPGDWQRRMDEDGYHTSPVVRVAETAAQFRSGKAAGIIPDTDIVRFLDAFYSEIEAKHGKNAVEAADKINEIAAQHIEDINENRRQRSIAEASKLADQAANRRELSGMEAGRQTGAPEVGSGEPPEGLASREQDQEYNKLSRLRLRGGMGDPNSAGLITGDNDVFVGRYHEDLAKEAGYKEPAKGPGNIHDAFFRDGGVRIRGAGGVVHIDFMDSNADTFDRVYRAIQSVPDANKYYVDFRPIKNGTGFHIDAYDKDNLIYRLKDLEEGREAPVRPGSVAAFRQGLFARAKEPRFPGLPPNGSRTWEEIAPHLDEDIKKHDTPEKQNLLTAAFNTLPDAREYEAAARAGRVGQMWYERSSRAFDALVDAGIDSIKPADKEKFLNFVSALSPVQKVRGNLLMAINLWSKWDKAGRPLDTEWTKGKPDQNSELYKLLKGGKGQQGVDLASRLNNAIRALQGRPLSGPKVSAFAPNLGADAGRVTNDTWMAVFGDQDPGTINRPEIYDAMSAKVREAAKAVGIEPRQAQAAIWSFIKTLAELSGWGEDRWIPPQEIIKNGWLTPELVAMHSSDFADLLQNDQEIRRAIQNIGGNLDALDQKLQTYVPGKPSAGEAAGTSDVLFNPARRLETARANAKIRRLLEAKVDTPQRSFDFERATDFNPDDFDRYTGAAGVLGGKYMPLYSRESVPNPDVQKLARNYNKERGIDKVLHEGNAPVDVHLAKRVADAYERMEHNPDAPETKAAYAALIKETKAQWDAAEKAGYKIEPWTKPGQPYANSAEMAADVRDNKHLYYFQGGDVPKSHPLAGVDPETGETYNNIFRAVHDLFGHAKNDYEFGPRGEENAFLAHSRMYSDKAIPALLSETKGQNSWVNFGPHLRDGQGNIPGRGEEGYVPPTARPYAEQKAGLLPKNLIEEAKVPARPNNGLFSRDRENPAPTWYLKSNKLIDQRMQGPMPADTVLKMLENNGVKPDELKYTGLAELLHEKGKEPVRPEELKKFLDANNLQVKEVTHGNSADWHRILALPFSQRTPEEQLLFERENAKGGEAKFGSYVLPGGQNYQEMLLTLPEKMKTQQRYKVLDENGNVVGTQEGLPTPGQLDAAKESGWRIEPYTQKSPSEQGNFRSSHWDEPNVVGHVRFNDRVGPNGEKLLHLEELQSDWHQKGRTQGYRTPTSGDLPQGWKIDVKPSSIDDSTRWEIHDEHGNYVSGGRGTRETALENARQWLNESGNAGKVPDAPFKKTWPELLMKRMIRYAAENGYDGISWTPGEEQAARYDLSKQVDEIRAYKHGDGTYSVAATKDAGRGTADVLMDKTGVKESELPDLIGKELANKIVQQPVGPEKSYRGLDLKVGGEGMKGFYDKIVPEMANKLGKQFGAKVGETSVEVPPKLGHEKYVYEGPELTADQLKAIGFDWNAPAVINDQARQVRHAMIDDGMSFREAVARYGSPSLARHIGGEMTITKPVTATKVPYFPITDSMRESVMKQGQPLFARESPNNGQLQHQIDTNVFKNQPKEYKDQIRESLRQIATNTVPENVRAASRYMRSEEAKTAEIGGETGLLQNFIENHQTRHWEKQNPQGKVVSAQAKTGKFATSVSAARHQVYDSTLTGLLKSPVKMIFDPANATAQGRVDILKAAANKKWLSTIMDQGLRDSTGRPAAYLAGSGRVVAGENGTDPRIFVKPTNPNFRSLSIADSDIQRMTQSGDLQRFLEDGTIRDITPYVRPNNIGAAIARLEEQAGRSTPASDEHGQNPLRTQIMLLKSMQANGDFSGLKDFNDALTKKYTWDPQGYIALAKDAVKGWNFISNSPDGTPVMVHTDVMVSPEFAEYFQNRLGLAPSEIAKNPIGKALLGAGSKLKHTLLSLSPFHMVQEALRGIMVGINPFHITGPDILTGEKIDPADPSSPTIIHKAVENGFTTGTDYKSLQDHSEGLSSGGGILDKIPGVGKVIGNSLNWYQDFLFKRYIPALKARSVELMYHEYQRLHPDWSVDRIAKAAAVHANDTFGGINWKAMGRSATTQDWGRLMFLAPDWLESEMRSGARLFNKDEGGLGRAQVAKMALGLWGIARVLNLVTTGNAHYEAPFGLATKNKEGKETVFSIRTLPTDILHSVSDPVGFIKGRLSPTVRLGQELISNRDQFGRKLQPQDLWVDVFRNMSPLPLQAVGQAVSGMGPEVGNVGQTVKALGGTATVYRTPAQKMAADLASSHTPDGPIDPAKMERHRRIIELEDKARSGEVSWPDLYKLAYATDQITPEELKQIETNVKNTQGMDHGMASLYARASRLPAKEYLDLLDVANNSEKAALATLTLKVQKKYLTKARKEETPAERDRDPIFQKFLHMTPGVKPGPVSQVVPPVPAPIQKEVSHLYRAINPETGHRIVHNGSEWLDAETGEPISA